MAEGRDRATHPCELTATRVHVACVKAGEWSGAVGSYGREIQGEEPG